MSNLPNITYLLTLVLAEEQAAAAEAMDAIRNHPGAQSIDKAVGVLLSENRSEKKYPMQIEARNLSELRAQEIEVLLMRQDERRQEKDAINRRAATGEAKDLANRLGNAKEELYQRLFVAACVIMTLGMIGAICVLNAAVHGEHARNPEKSSLLVPEERSAK